MNIQRFLAAGIMAILISTFPFIACSTDGGSSEQSSAAAGTTTIAGTSTTATADLSAAHTWSVDFGTFETVDLTITGIKGSTVVLARLNEGSSALSYTATGTAALASSSSSASVRSTAAESSDTIDSIPTTGMPHRIPHTLATGDNQKDYRASATSGSGLSRSTTASGTSYIAYGESSSSYVEGSTTVAFWVDYTNARGTTSFDRLTATLVKVTDHAYIWVANNDYTDNKKATSTFSLSTLSSGYSNLLGDAFESVVFPGDTSIFGYEYGGGSSGTGGVDADQHIDILLYDIDFDNNAEASTSGYVAGYFWSKDETTASTSNTYTTTGVPPSNGREIFYLDAKALEDDPWTIVSTLAHEYQHMIQWNEVNNGTRTNVGTWQNEFQSLMAEELLSPALAAYAKEQTWYTSSYYDYFSDGPGAWSTPFNYAYYSDVGLGYYNSSVYDYMFASIYGAYLMRSYGGLAFMQDYLKYLDAKYTAATAFADAVILASLRTTETDGTAIHAYAPTSVSTSDFFGSTLESFALALYGLGADGTASESPFTRGDAQAWSASGTNALSAFTIDTSIYAYGSSTYHSSGHLLPDYIPISSRLKIMEPYSFSFHSDSSLIDAASDSVSLTLTAPTSSNVKFLLIKVPQ